MGVGAKQQLLHALEDHAELALALGDLGLGLIALALCR
jgi:hypothetical protein